MASMTRVINFLLVPFIPKGREKFWSRENRGEVIRKSKNKNSLCLHLTLRLPGKGSRVCKIKRAKIKHIFAHTRSRAARRPGRHAMN